MVDARKPIFAPPPPNMDDPDLPLNSMVKEFETTKEKILDQNPKLVELYKRAKNNPNDKMASAEYSLEVIKVWREGQVARLSPVDRAMY